MKTTSCWCATCHPNTIYDQRMIVCPRCGNKRCPHATNHEYACTNSNALDQVPTIGPRVYPRDHMQPPITNGKTIPVSTMRWGVLFRWGSCWIGAHWAPHNKRLCINVVPFVTIWIVWPGGLVP